MQAKGRREGSVGARIRQLRIEAGLTQSALARLVGTQQPAIARLERGDYDGHSLATLRRIAAALHHELRIVFEPGELR